MRRLDPGRSHGTEGKRRALSPPDTSDVVMPIIAISTIEGFRSRMSITCH